jgi:hypothetical protein
MKWSRQSRTRSAAQTMHVAVFKTTCLRLSRLFAAMMKCYVISSKSKFLNHMSKTPPNELRRHKTLYWRDSIKIAFSLLKFRNLSKKSNIYQISCRKRENDSSRSTRLSSSNMKFTGLLKRYRKSEPYNKRNLRSWRFALPALKRRSAKWSTSARKL